MATVQYAILGAGAMGTILGAHLVRAGHSVVMLARDKRAAEIERDGLRIRGLVEFSTPVAVLRDPSQLQSEVLIVATKTSGTREALSRFRRDAASVVFSIQNGLEKNELLQAAFGPEKVLGALANISGEMLENGEVLFTRNVNIYVGELQEATSARAAQIARVIDAAGVRAAARSNILGLEWSKFCAWAGMMAMSIITRAVTWQYLCHPGSARVVAQLVRELGRIASALQVTLTDQSMLPIASMCSGSESEAVDTVLRLGAQFRSDAPQHRMSSLQDLDAGRPLEIEETLGYAHRKALEHGISAPLLDAFYHIAGTIDRIRRSDNLELLEDAVITIGRGTAPSSF
jgi:2-dehydropantoate 2-reductase